MLCLASELLTPCSNDFIVYAFSLALAYASLAHKRCRKKEQEQKNSLNSETGGQDMHKLFVEGAKHMRGVVTGTVWTASEHDACLSVLSNYVESVHVSTFCFSLPLFLVVFGCLFLFSLVIDVGYWILDTECWMSDVGSSMPDAGCWMLDAHAKHASLYWVHRYRYACDGLEPMMRRPMNQ